MYKNTLDKKIDNVKFSHENVVVIYFRIVKNGDYVV